MISDTSNSISLSSILIVDDNKGSRHSFKFCKVLFRQLAMYKSNEEFERWNNTKDTKRFVTSKTSTSICIFHILSSVKHTKMRRLGHYLNQTFSAYFLSDGLITHLHDIGIECYDDIYFY